MKSILYYLTQCFPKSALRTTSGPRDRLKQLNKNLPKDILVVTKNWSSGPQIAIQTDILCFAEHLELWKSFGSTDLTFCSRRSNELKIAKESILQNFVLHKTDIFSVFFLLLSLTVS
jgi:hypothetical protein